MVPKSRCLIFIVAYQAETTIADVVKRIPSSLSDRYDVEVLIIDDSSKDRTFETSYALTKQAQSPFKIHVLFNPVNQGYGGNQKLGYHFAIAHDYDFVALVHGDGQYAPDVCPPLWSRWRMRRRSRFRLANDHAIRSSARRYADV